MLHTTLIINAGSSSLRFELFDAELNSLAKGHWDALDPEQKTTKTHAQAIAKALKSFSPQLLASIKKVGHRVVHGGEKYTKTTAINANVLADLKKLSKLAPLHNPANIAGIEAAQKLLPKAKHYALFDTAFHSSLPQKAYLYGLPYSLYKKQGIRRYGFHGNSHAFLARTAEKILKKSGTKLVTCHLGNGVSLAAIHKGKSLDTSMGFTPLEGPLMGTRSGSLDPAILLYLMEQGYSTKKLTHLLEKESGFLGVSEKSSDVRVLHSRPKDPGTQRSFELFSYQISKLICSYFVPLQGLPDVIVFSAGIGENAHYLRKQICDALKPFGLKLNTKANVQNQILISQADSSIKVLVIPTEEAQQMAHSLRVLT